MENPSDNPQVAFQPVMCQHCNHAPCETVCPVAATSHGRQGQNIWLTTVVLVLDIVLTTVLIKYVVLTGSYTTKTASLIII
jgi:heme/copper-type cytochrome/quinol oxidase subunit 4